MDKLIELLNKEMEEKEKAGPKLARFTSYDGINKVFSLNNGCHFGVEFVLSKRFEFIKWLVDNDKIDNSKFYDKNILKGFMTLTKEEKADSIIMNLSIQDTPIEFLVSILK